MLRPQEEEAVPGGGRSGRVSVVIPAYNAAATLEAAVESCLVQDYPDVEVIVVDDGSSDASPEILAALGDRVRVLRQANGGLASARNAGQRAATGEFIAWMDADDLAVPGRLRVQVEVLQAHPAVGLVSSDFSAFTDPTLDFDPAHWGQYYSASALLGGAPALYPDLLSPAHLAGHPVEVRAGEVAAHLIWGNFVHPPTVLVRRGLLEEAGFSDETLRYSSDYDLILRMARRTRFAFVAGALLRYRRSPTQMSHVNAGHAMQLETVRILEKVAREAPDLAVQTRPLLRRRTAESLVAAANHVAASERWRAIRLLVRAARHQLLLGASSVAVGRMVIPPAMLPHLKHVARAVFRLAVLWCTTGGSEAWGTLGLVLGA